MRNAGVAIAILLSFALVSPASAVDYERDVKPILRAHCYNCHGPLRQKSGLRLDHLSFIRQGGDAGTTLAEKGDTSPLITAVLGTGDVERMPLEAEPLSAEHIATLKAWIDAGANAPDEPLPADPRDHWSFKNPLRAALPEVKSAAWSANPIDRFLAAAHEQQGLVPAPPAEKNVLLRRVYLDLVGLPPTTTELRAFLADTSDDAYEKVVDRLLASPDYGLRWGRHWMDVWRYSDWDGYGKEVRESRPHIWRWRDWIVESLNADRPYDQMIVEMLSADEVAPLDASAQRATGYLARNWYKFNRNVWLEHTVEHTSKAFLAVTLNCARCHDHMYDPILQTDYYSFRAFFEPHQVRTDRVPGESDTERDGLVHTYDAEADAKTFLFERGNEAKPDKEHPLAPSLPRNLGGDPLAIAPIALPAAAYYPGLQAFVQQETLGKALGDVDKSQAAVTGATNSLAEQRKKLADLLAAKTEPKQPAEAAAGNDPATPEKPEPVKADGPSAAEIELQAAIDRETQAAAAATSSMLAASAQLVAVRAKIAADNAAFATPPAADAKSLALEASRAQRVANVEQARHDVSTAERALAEAKKSAEAAGEKKEEEKQADKKKVEAAEAKLAEAAKTRDAAQTALAAAGDTYDHFGQVYPQTSTGRRAALARWIASKNNPLTARVAINHIWLRHFGTALVPTVFDFGANGAKPTHPELLDWLSVELMDNQWQMKAIHRLIVTSAAYRLRSSGGEPANLAHDPENRLLWRANPRRMEAEVVRDSTLRVADSLDPAMGGPELDENAGMTALRRSIYFRSSKEKKMTFLDTFDRANVTDCYRRSETIVPQQALAMVNSELSLVQARRLAGILSKESGAEPTAEQAFIASAFERILCRPPTDGERTACLEFLAQQATRLADPNTLTAFDAEKKPQNIDPHQRARENLVHVLLNHNDFLTVR